MQPPFAVQQAVAPQGALLEAERRSAASAALVIAIVASGATRLDAALRRVAGSPALLEATARIVVVDAGAAAAAPLLRESARLPAGLLRVVRRPRADRAEALAVLLDAAAHEAGASAVLVLDDAALTDPAALLGAVLAAGRTPGSEVVGLRDPSAAGRGPAAWWGAVLPLDAVRAVGATLPEAGEQALAELVLRAGSAGFRATVQDLAGPVPARDVTGALLLGLLHAPVAARTGLLAASLATDLRSLLALRTGPVARRRTALLGILRGPGAATVDARDPRRAGMPADAVRLHLRLWIAWPGMRRRWRTGALDRASAAAWADRLALDEVDGGLPTAEREEDAGRPAGIRSRAWPTAKRGTSAA